VDFSLAINWKIKNNKAVYDELVYKNKLPASGEPRLLRLICTDHCSGAFFVWYTAAPGESVSALIEGLWHAWNEKAVAGNGVKHVYPFRGVPRILMMDRGPGSRSQIFQNYLAWLGVTQNICEGPRSKGQVESAHWWWEQRFESRFRLDPVVEIARLNDEAVQFAAHLCKTQVHSRTNAARTAHWEFHINRSFESQLRVPNCSFEEAKRFAVSTAKTVSVAGSSGATATAFPKCSCRSGSCRWSSAHSSFPTWWCAVWSRTRSPSSVSRSCETNTASTWTAP